MVHTLFGPEVQMMLLENNDAAMKVFTESLHPATIAETLTGPFSVEEVWRVLKHTSIRQQAAIFEYFPIEWQVRMAEGTGREHMAGLIEKMSHDDRVDLLRRLMPRVAEGLLRLVDEADRRDIATLVKQDINAAGGLMTTEYAWLPPDLTAAEALDRLRLQAPESETIYYIFILDDQRRLLGVVSLRDLILAPRHARMRDIMESEVVSVRASEPRGQVAKIMAQYDLIAMPVVDDHGRMVGIITHDDVIDLVVAEATEDVHRMGAVGPLGENYLTANFYKVWRNRAFWLACLFVAELFTFTALSHFDEAINKVVVLALFVPLCISTGGNSGSQAATLITRALALGQVTFRDWLKVLRHELLMGLALGLTLGAIGFVRGYMTPEDVRGNLERRADAFTIRVPWHLADQVTEQIHSPTLSSAREKRVLFPAGCLQESQIEGATQVILPETQSLQFTEVAGLDPADEKAKIYHVPAGASVRSEAVDPWSLAKVVALSVASICIWGTMVGSMLPLFFKRIGVDPGIASSPFVATFVDVTGIIIYFSIASLYLL